MPMTPEDKHARRVFMHLDSIQNSIADKASMVSSEAAQYYGRIPPQAFMDAVANVRTMLMHYISHPDSDLDTLDINGAPWPKPEDFPEEAPVLTLSEALATSLEDDELAPSDPLGPLEALRAKIDAVRAGTQELTPDELISMHRDDPPGAAAKLEDAIRALKGDARRKLSELLNVELAELKNLRGMAGEDREREQQIEYLLGLFTRLGEI